MPTATEGTSLPEGLDGEAKLILDQLEAALASVDFEGSTDNRNRDDKSNYNDDTDNSDDEEEDPDSGENELANLMESLVAELRADIQEQVVHEYDDSNEGTQEERHSPTLKDTTEDDETADLDSYTTSPSNQEKSDNLLSEEALPSPSSRERDPDHAQILDHSDCGKPLDPAKKEVLRRLLHHLDTGGVSIRRRRFYQENNIDRQPRQEQDRVYQEIPDLQSSPMPVQFEHLAPPNTHDPDFVAVQDFSPAKPKSLPSTPQQHQSSQNNEKITLPSPRKGDLNQNQHTQKAVSNNTGQYRRQRQRKRRTKKHKQPMSYNIDDNNPSNDESEVANLDSTDGIGPYHYYNNGTSDETIRRIADSDTWKRICQLVFNPSKSGKS